MIAADNSLQINDSLDPIKTKPTILENGTLEQIVLFYKAHKLTQNKTTLGTKKYLTRHSFS